MPALVYPPDTIGIREVDPAEGSVITLNAHVLLLVLCFYSLGLVADRGGMHPPGLLKRYIC